MSDSVERPAPLDSVTRQRMVRQKRRNTKPEVLVRRQLHARGLRFRVGLRELPGSPDIAFTRVRLAVFIDGCFWHLCPRHSTVPRNNRDWWTAKLEANRERDQRQTRALEELGWTVRRHWEHEDPTTVADALEALWRELSGRV